jgi:hypothetical protein
MVQLYKWFPLYLEPIFNSEERYCSLLAIEDEATQFNVINIFSNEKVRNALGAKHRAFGVLLNRIEQDLIETHQKLGSVDDWIPPVEGVFRGKTRLIEAESLNEILTHAESFVSFLLDSAALAVSPAVETEEKFDSFLSTVKSEVIAAKPLLRSSFDIPFREKKNSYSVGFYFSPIVVANFSYLSVGNNLDATFNRTLKKFLEIELIGKKHNLQKSIQYIRIPHLASLSRKTQTTLEARIEAIEEYSHLHDVSIKTVHEPAQISSDLISSVNF